jgi:hypothetical protein
VKYVRNYSTASGGEKTGLKLVDSEISHFTSNVQCKSQGVNAQESLWLFCVVIPPGFNAKIMQIMPNAVLDL